MADLVLHDGKGTTPSVYLQIRTDYLAPLDLPSDVLLTEIAVKEDYEAVILGEEDIIEGDDKVRYQFRDPWKRRGGLSSGPLCERG